MTGGPERPTGSKRPVDLPLRRAMSAPLLATFGVLSVVALAAAIVLLLKPTTLVPTPVTERRPAPGHGFTHDPGRLAPAPTPSVAPTFDPPCDTFAGTQFVMSGDGVVRVREALDRLCRLSAGGVGDELVEAIENLGAATIRFAQFEVSALESTLDIADRTIWLNLRFARRGTPVEELLPPLIHDAFHLSTVAPTALQEWHARRAELDACKQLIAREDWPRWCEDAEAIATLSEADARDALENAGFPVAHPTAVGSAS